VLAAAGRPVRWLAARTMAGGNSILHCKWELFVFVILLGVEVLRNGFSHAAHAAL